MLQKIVWTIQFDLLGASNFELTHPLENLTAKNIKTRPPFKKIKVKVDRHF